MSYKFDQKRASNTNKQYQLRPRSKKSVIAPKTVTKMASVSTPTQNQKLDAHHAGTTPSVKVKHAAIRTEPGSATPANSDIAAQGAIPRSNARMSQHGEAVSASMLTAISQAVKSAVAESNCEINQKLDKVLRDIAYFRSELDATNKAVAELQVSVNDTSERISVVETTTIPDAIAASRQMVADLEQKLLQQEIHLRKMNLLFYGVSQKKDEDVYVESTKAIADLLNISYDDAEKIPISNAHRLPTARTPRSASNSPDPIIIRFSRMADRDEILKAFEHPDYARRRQRVSDQESAGARRRITVRSDLPPSMKRERGRLSSIAYTLRKEKKLMTKIEVVNTSVTLQVKRNREDAWTSWVE